MKAIRLTCKALLIMALSLSVTACNVGDTIIEIASYCFTAVIIGGIYYGIVYGIGSAIESIQNKSKFRSYRKAAMFGDAYSQYKLGQCYYNGTGVTQDYEEATRWYSMAAEQGFSSPQFAEALNNLGVCYDNGEGVPQNLEEAVKWYRKAAEQGNAVAQYNLGYSYDNGEGVEQNLEEAVKWYRKAAEQGNKWAQNNLGVCYDNGKGVPQNKEEAAKWYRKAAEQGHAGAQNSLGWYYYEQGKPELGLPYAEQSVKTDANEASWDTLGRIYYDLGRYEDCITAMTKCAAIPNCSTLQIAYEYIGNSYNKLGNEDEGSQWLEKAKYQAGWTTMPPAPTGAARGECPRGVR
ncbi:MAG: sel1 repeat family protein [Prevotellaceae bacterium]|nr:sel1 repeat family protein [Prevotellaceae bacterium]